MCLEFDFQAKCQLFHAKLPSSFGPDSAVKAWPFQYLDHLPENRFMEFWLPLQSHVLSHKLPPAASGGLDYKVPGDTTGNDSGTVRAVCPSLLCQEPLQNWADFLLSAIKRHFLYKDSFLQSFPPLIFFFFGNPTAYSPQEVVGKKAYPMENIAINRNPSGDSEINRLPMLTGSGRATVQGLMRMFSLYNGIYFLQNDSTSSRKMNPNTNYGETLALSPVNKGKGPTF